MDETELVRLMQQGEEGAFDQIFALYKNRLLKMAFLISGNYADSEDIVQETFVKLFYYQNKIKKPENFSSWIYRTLTRTAWRYCKKKNREQPADDLPGSDLADPHPPVLDQMILQEEQQILYQRIRELELKQRTVIVLYYFNQLSTREISNILNCMEGTVKSRLFTARKNLGKSLSNSVKNEEVMPWKKNSLIL